MPVLSTKLFIPELRDDRVRRRALVDKMASGIRMNTKLTLVSAPAGYGKTSLVIELIEFLDMTTTWLSLDESESDLPQFLSYCIAALKKAGVMIGVESERMALDFALSSTQAPMTMIINDIAAFSEKIILVLDDFHLIRSPNVHNAVKFLLEHQPPNFHLVIITREDPSLPLSQLRVQREITEIRMEELCFTTEETVDFLCRVMELKLSPEAVKAIAYRTEGWAAGLQLVGLSLNNCEERDVVEFIEAYKDTNRYIIDYLVEEVISHQPYEIRDFLCKTSVLDRMNGNLCDSITGANNSRQLLYELEKANLFVIPLDSKRDWYRYHHLFADSLRAELTEEEEQGMHKKAAAWFWDNGFKQEAIKHALKSGDMILSQKLLEDSTEDVFKNAQLSMFVSWTNSIHEDFVKGSEILSVRKAWALYLTGRMSEARQYMNSLGEDFIEKTTQHNKGLILSLKAIMAQQAGCGDPEVLAEEALRFLEAWDPMARISTLNILGRAQESRGKTAKANETFKMAYNESLKLGFTFITTLALKSLCTSLNIMGKCCEAMELYTAYIERMMKEFGKLPPFIGIAYLGLAELFYERNQLDKAKDYMEEGMELCRSISYDWAPYTEFVKARIQFAAGEREAAIRNMEHALISARSKNIPGLATINIAVLTELLLRDGKLNKAKEYEAVFESQIENIGMGASEVVYLAYARLLIYRKAGNAVLGLLEALERETYRSRKLKELIVVYILYAEVYYSAKEYEKADEYIDKAVELAEPQEYYRLFLEDEELVKGIILHRKKERGQFLQKLAEYLKVCVPEEKAPRIESTEVVNSWQGNLDGLKYIEKLSKREVEILSLIAEGMSNNDIANALYISTNTTQWHISHIYSKLEVKSRTQAVLKARAWGIL